MTALGKNYWKPLGLVRTRVRYVHRFKIYKISTEIVILDVGHLYGVKAFLLRLKIALATISALVMQWYWGPGVAKDS